MQVRFLLGPAGSGKTHRCLSEIRRELVESPEGPPLVLLAPKQATYQLERQLFEQNEIGGYTRLRIVSFERLAGFITGELGAAPARVLSEEGRVMVLRALLLRHGESLTIYRGSAKRAGFVQELSELLRELQQHRVSPAALRQIAQRREPSDPLGRKLGDLARLLEAYANWLRERDMRDADHQIEHASDLLRRRRANGGPENAFKLGGLWLDGFAELTPQERWVLLALIPHTPRMTLTFCLESIPHGDPGWLSVWSPTARLYRECLSDFSARPDAEVRPETLERRSDTGRFSKSVALEHLEKHWSLSKCGVLSAECGVVEKYQGDAAPLVAASAQEGVCLFKCATPEVEAVLACREIRRFARSGGRYRDAAILLRGMAVYEDILPRILTRYEIPFFIDRRVAMSHHPLVELTQYALRILCHHWRIEDLFGAWKTGFFRPDDNAIDRLENEALKYGWQGEIWRSLPPGGGEFEPARRDLVQPIEVFSAVLGNIAACTGSVLANALGRLWTGLGVETKLAEWDQREKKTLHGTVWNEMQSWRKNLELAFSNQTLSVREWLATVEAGLAGLTVGAVPPALDQVLIGTVDRSRNPDLQLTILLGMNEGTFPLTPPPPKLLTELERDSLNDLQLNLSGNRRQFLGRERFFGYIACTRSRQRLVLAFAARNLAGEVINPSPFIAHVQSILPELPLKDAHEHFGWEDGEHPSEMLGQALREERHFERSQHLTALLNLPAVQNLLRRLPIFRAVERVEPLPKELVGQLFGRELRTSVSALEKFAACPFQFFIHHTLRGRERPEFEIGARERGSFFHEVLAAYHDKLAGQGRAWRDLSPEEARGTVRQVAEELSRTFNHGLMEANAAARFDSENLTRRLEEFIMMETSWMRHYSFDPWRTEYRFGLREAGLPAWRIELNEGRAVLLEGKIDRVDILRDVDSGERQAVVIDYKSGGAKFDGVMTNHGITMQLPAYLNMLRFSVLPDSSGKLAPAGMFYAPLLGDYKPVKRRNESSGVRDPDEERWRAFQFRGRFVAEKARQFDDQAKVDCRGTHFAFQIKKDGGFSAKPEDATPSKDFEALLDRNVETIRSIAQRIYDGEAKLDPYKKGTKSACDHCDCHAICRVNVWTQPFRALSIGPPTESQTL